MNKDYTGSRPMERGVYAAPRREILRANGTVKRYECSACGQRVSVSLSECGCGVQLLGREFKVER